MLFKRIFNATDLGLSLDKVRKTISQLLNDQDELDMTTRREFKFKVMNDGYYSRDNNIYNQDEARQYAIKEIRNNFAYNVKFENFEETITRKNLKIKIIFSFRTNDDLWLLKNLDQLQAVLSENITFLGDKEYVFNFIGNKVKFRFLTNNVNNGQFLVKMNKDQDVYQQLNYFLLFLEEEKIEVFS